MLDPRQLEDLAKRLGAVIPPGLKGLRRELEDNFRAVLRANLDQWELVSRERFDVQAELLARTQARLRSLEERLAALEQPGAGGGAADAAPPPLDKSDRSSSDL